jgi:hypothetical protein
VPIPRDIGFEPGAELVAEGHLFGRESQVHRCCLLLLSPS